MGRKDFMADMAAASNSPPVPSISKLQIDEDGESISFQYDHGYGRTTILRAVMTDNSCYPRDNTYFLSAENDASIDQALQQIQDSLEGLTINRLLNRVSSVIGSLGDGTEGSPMVLDTPPGSTGGASLNSRGSSTSQLEEDENDAASDSDEDFHGQNWFGDDSADELPDGDGIFERKRNVDPESAAKLNKRIVEDLKQLRMAGFRVGIINGMRADSFNSILSASLRVSKLGLSEEVLQAWNLERHHYIVLLIQYLGGYETFGDVLKKPVRDLRITFRMGISNRYKPTLSEAIAAFSEVKRSNVDPFAPGHRRGNSNGGSGSPTKFNKSGFSSPTKASSPRKKRSSEERDEEFDHGFRLSFISSPMRQLMDELFLNLVKIRHTYGCGWEGAKHHLREQKHLTQLADKHEYVHIEEIPCKKDLPEIVTADHLTEDIETTSFPLVAMQFAMLYLMRCTEFCLVCHKKTEETFEAIKPYVCSDPLCLYQYMSLGFGPSIEHEILTQPYVVDLLISFCYAAASADTLRGYPDGMGLVVAPPPANILETLIGMAPAAFPVSVYPQKPAEQASLQDTRAEWMMTQLPVNVDLSRRIIELKQINVCEHLRSGDWIQVTIDDPFGKRTVHRKVEKYEHPLIYFMDLVEPKTPRLGTSPALQSGQWSGTRAVSTEVKEVQPSEPRKKEEPGNNVSQNSTMSLYSLKFDNLEGLLKAAIIAELLQTLPSVQEMAEYLSQNGASEARLMGWVDRISPAALGLLRWIVASNRSCIVQVDQAPGQSSSQAIRQGVRLDQKLTGLSQYMQFRFAQGAPDKEDKFHKALESKKSATGRFESIFAWHGSSLVNWHSIIRTGLDFATTVNGRAYGHGVYCSPDFNVSLGYCGSNRIANFAVGAMGRPSQWPQSALQIQNALCLNEIVNVPEEFTSRDPHLVVQHTTWIQCRYLLVQCLGQQIPDRASPDSMFSTKQNSAKGLTLADMETRVREQQLLGQKADPVGPFIVQDPKYFARVSSQRVNIPRTAFPASRNFIASKDGADSRPSSTEPMTGLSGANAAFDGFQDNTSRKKRKSTNGKALKLSPAKIREVVSEDSDLEDIAFFRSEDEVKTASQSLFGLGMTAYGKAKLPATHDANGKPFTDFVPGSLDRSRIQQLAPPAYGTSTSARSIQRELRNLLDLQASTPLHELGWYIDGDSISNLYQWIIELHSFPAELPLAKDMKKAGITSVVLEIRFGPQFPNEPPFVRVVRPRFLPFMSGGGGHVTAGGALCMELLTNSGWSVVSTIESVLLQVRMAIMSTDPKPARLTPGAGGVAGGAWDYGVGEAVEAYERACRTHGWAFPNMRGVGGEEVPRSL